jgi:hypothetical protein
MSDIHQADLPSNCPGFDRLIEVMTDIAVATAKWNGFGPINKALLPISVKSGTSLASKYQEIFCLKFALLDRVEQDLLNAVIVSTAEGIGLVQGKLSSFTHSNELAMSVIAQQKVCLCYDIHAHIHTYALSSSISAELYT